MTRKLHQVNWAAQRTACRCRCSAATSQRRNNCDAPEITGQIWSRFDLRPLQRRDVSHLEARERQDLDVPKPRVKHAHVHPRALPGRRAVNDLPHDGHGGLQRRRLRRQAASEELGQVEVAQPRDAALQVQCDASASGGYPVVQTHGAAAASHRHYTATTVSHHARQVGGLQTGLRSNTNRTSGTNKGT
jgi:hypothetical protein